MTFGKPKGKHVPRQRKPSENFIFRDTYGKFWQEQASLEPAAGGDDNAPAVEGSSDWFTNEIACANSFLNNTPCADEAQQLFVELGISKKVYC